MKAVVFHGIGDIRLDTVREPGIKDPTDAIVRLTASAVCGTDLHMVRGTMPGMKPGTILGHEGVGIVEEVGKGVRNLRRGDRVVVPSTISCGNCNYCRSGYTAQCDDANPNSPTVGTAFFGAHLAEVGEGDVVAVWGAGPVGLFAVLSAFQLGATRVIAVDGHDDRLASAQMLGAETVNFNQEHPVEAIKELTRGIGTDRAIDAVGVDSERPKRGPAAKEAEGQAQPFQQEVQQVAKDAKPQGDQWKPGDAPSQAITWAVQSLAKAGTLGVIGVYPQTDRFFPLGAAMNKNLTVHMGNCNHKTYIPKLVAKVESGTVDPTQVLSHVEPMTDAIEAYKQFDLRQPGWIKVELAPSA